MGDTVFNVLRKSRLKMPKKIVNIRLRPDQEERINAIVERSAILDTSKFVRIAVDWLLRSDIGEVIKKIVDDEAFPDYQVPKKPLLLLRRERGDDLLEARVNCAFFAPCVFCESDNRGMLSHRQSS